MRISETAVGIIVTIGIWLSLVLLAWRIGLLVFNLCKKRSHRIPYIRNYKKGNFIGNYPIMMLIYFIGILYEEQNLSTAFSSSITAASDFLVLNLETDPIDKLIEASLLYRCLVDVGYLLVVVGTVLLTLSLTQQYLWDKMNALRAKMTRKEKMYLLGYNPDNLAVCESDGKERFKYIVEKLGKEEQEKLYIENIPYISVSPDEWIEDQISYFSRAKKKKAHFYCQYGQRQAEYIGLQMLCAGNSRRSRFV